MILISIVSLLDVMQIVLWARDRLRPVYLIGLNTFQLVFWGIIIVLDIVGIAKYGQDPRGIAMAVVML